MPTPDIGVISGNPNTGLENSNKLIRSVDPILHFFQVDKHPLASSILTAGMKLAPFRENSSLPKLVGKPIRKRAVNNMKVEWFEDSDLKREFSATAAVTASATSLTVSSSDDDYFKANDKLLLTNASGQTEVVIISSVSANTLNVTNLDTTARTAGIAMTTSDKFYRMGNTRAEDSTAPALRSTKSANLYNYLEIMSKTFGLTRIKRATGHYTGDPMAEEKMKAYSEFLRDLEYNFILGVRDISGSTTNPVTHMGGAKYWMEQFTDCEVRNLSGRSFTKTEADSFISKVSQGGSTDKILLCDSRALTAFNGFGYETVQSQNFRIGEIGMNLKKVFGPMGEITLVHERLFDEVAPLRGSAMLLDLNDIEYCYLSGNGVDMDIHEEVVQLADGSLSDRSQIVGAMCLKFNTLQHSGWVKNIGN